MKKLALWGSIFLLTALVAGCQGNSAQAGPERPVPEAGKAEEEAAEDVSDFDGLERAAAELDGEVVTELYERLDSDSLEDLAVCTRGGENTITLWFIPGAVGKAIKVSETGLQTAALDLSFTEGGYHLIFNSYNETGNAMTFEIWDLNGDEPVLMAEGDGNAWQEDGEIRVDVEDYDGMFMQGTGLAVHTRKTAYIFFDDDDYKEYGAVQLSGEEFLDLENAGVIMDILQNEEEKAGARTTSFAFFYRANGLVEVQTFSELEDGDRVYRITTLPCRGNVLDLEQRSTGDGQVRESYTGLFKIYPERGISSGAVSRERLEGSFYSRLMDGGQVFPESAGKVLTWEDLEKLAHDPVEEEDKLLRLAVNEIYARHGYIFGKVKWFDYFYRQFDWYEPSLSDASAVDGKLTAAEKENLKILTEAESGGRWNPAEGAALRNVQDEDLLDLMTGTQRREHLTGSDGFNSYDLTCQVPYIRMDSYDARSYNALLRREIYPYIDDAEKALGKGYSPWLYGVDYKAYVWKNTLTVLTRVRGDWGIDLYFPVTLDLDTGEKLGNEQVAALYGMDPEEAKEAVRDAMGTYYRTLYSGAADAAGESFFKGQLEKTLASSNTEAALLYPASDGTPYLSCTIYSLAGADAYNYCIPLRQQ